MKRRTGSFGSFGALRNINQDLLENTELKDDWKALEDSTRSLVKLRCDYKDAVEGFSRTQVNIRSSIKSYKSSITELKNCIEDSELPDDRKQKVLKALKDKSRLGADMEKILPKKSSLLLQLAIGDVNVTLPRMGDRILYKTAYEDFKLRMSFVALSFMGMSLVLNWKGVGHRPLTFLFQVFLVWYYSTITLREHILIANGSKIRSWWLWHHYLSIIVVCLLVIWPNGWAMREFLRGFEWFCFYVAFIQLMEFQYQRRRMYTLNALGKEDNMRPIGEGVSWNSSLSVLVPFLLFGQVWQLYQGYVLYALARDQRCHEWVVPVMSVLMLILGVGNLYTTLTSAKQKFGLLAKARDLPELKVVDASAHTP